MLGRLTKHTIEGTLLGAAAGYFYSESTKKVKPTDVTIDEGVEFGVELNHQLEYSPSRSFVTARDNYLNSSHASTVPSTDDIKVYIDGKKISFADSKPIIDNGIVLVPLAPVLDQNKTSYKYNEDLQSVNPDTDLGTLQMNIGRSYAMLNGDREELEAPAVVRNGIVFVPLHFLALATGTRLVWMADTRIVNMYVPS